MKTVFGQNTVHPDFLSLCLRVCIISPLGLIIRIFKMKLRHAGCQRIRGAYANEINGPGSQIHLFTN